MESRAVRESGGYRYELIITYVDAGSAPYVEYIPATWKLLRDDAAVMDHDEAHRLRRDHFGEW